MCKTDFNNASNCENHEKYCSGDTERPFKCPCGKLYANKKHMRYHKKKYDCDKVCYHEQCYLHLSFSVRSHCEKYRCNIFCIILEIWRFI